MFNQYITSANHEQPFTVMKQLSASLAFLGSSAMQSSSKASTAGMMACTGCESLAHKNQETPCTQWLVRVSTHHIQFWPLHLNCCGVSLWWSYKRLHCSWRPKPASPGGANPPLIRTHPMVEFIQTEVRSPSHARTTKLSSCHQMSCHSSCTRKWKKE